MQQWALHMPHVQTQHNPGTDSAGSAGEGSCSCHSLSLDFADPPPSSCGYKLAAHYTSCILVASMAAQRLFGCCVHALCWGFCPSIAFQISAALQFGQRSEEEDQVIQEAEQQLGKSESKLTALLQQVCSTYW